MIVAREPVLSPEGQELQSERQGPPIPQTRTVLGGRPRRLGGSSSLSGFPRNTSGIFRAPSAGTPEPSPDADGFPDFPFARPAPADAAPGPLAGTDFDPAADALFARG